MSFVELPLNIRSLSRLDKLRLIQMLARDLAVTEGPDSEPADGTTIVAEEGDAEILEDQRVRQAVHAVGLRNAVGRMEEDEAKNGPGKMDLTDFDRVWSDMIESGQSLPVRFPDQSYEAAAILARLLEEGKSAS